ncbi:MAG: hypothetical protein Q9M94_02605 [Candidatus Gracilibacteria bacterium]|nr:hypothetical protein [Candidatus Gracilibacteria bacterium]
MKLLSSILVGLFFVIIGILKLNGYLYLEEVYLFGVEGMGKTDISWFLTFFHSLLIIPTIIDVAFSEFILKFLNKYFIINFNTIFLGIIFTFYFLFSFILSLILGKISFKKDKYIIFISFIVLYFLLLYYLKYILV